MPDRARLLHAACHDGFQCAFVTLSLDHFAHFWGSQDPTCAIFARLGLSTCGAVVARAFVATRRDSLKSPLSE